MLLIIAFLFLRAEASDTIACNTPRTVTVESMTTTTVTLAQGVLPGSALSAVPNGRSSLPPSTMPPTVTPGLIIPQYPLVTTPPLIATMASTGQPRNLTAPTTWAFSGKWSLPAPTPQSTPSTSIVASSGSSASCTSLISRLALSITVLSVFVTIGVHN